MDIDINHYHDVDIMLDEIFESYTKYTVIDKNTVQVHDGVLLDSTRFHIAEVSFKHPTVTCTLKT